MEMEASADAAFLLDGWLDDAALLDILHDAALDGLDALDELVVATGTVSSGTETANGNDGDPQQIAASGEAGSTFSKQVPETSVQSAQTSQPQAAGKVLSNARTETMKRKASASARNPSRERLQAELKFLRHQVAALESELNSLITSQQEEVVNAAVASEWQSIADRHLQQRRHSEQENRELRQQLARQLSVARNLESFLNDHLYSNAENELDGLLAASMRPSKRRQARPPPRPPGDELVHMLFMQFSHEIERRLYPMTSSVFAGVFSSGSNVSPAGLGTRPMKVLQDPAVKIGAHGDGQWSDQIFVESRGEAVVAFSNQHVCDAVWRALGDEFRQRGRAIESSLFMDDLVALKCRGDTGSREPRRRTSFALVARRFVESEDRAVIIWRSMQTEEGRRGQGTYPEAFTDAFGWVLVERTVSIDRLNVTRIAVCARCAPQWSCRDDVSRETVLSALLPGSLTIAALNSVQEDASAIARGMESILLNDAL